LLVVYFGTVWKLIVIFLCAYEMYYMYVLCVSVEHYVSELHKQDQAVGEGVYAVPTGAHVKDNEQVTSQFSS